MSIDNDRVQHRVPDSVLQQAARYRCLASLSGDWAHELRGVLNVIHINHALVARVLQQPGGDNVALGRRCLAALESEVGRLDRFIELLDAPPGDRERVFDVVPMLERLVRLVSARASRQRVEVALETTGEPREISGFEDQLQAALLILIVNALDAMPDRGRLLLRAEGGPTVVLRVCDSGPGLPLERRQDPWAGAGAHESACTGTGLHATRSIVEAHGGWIEYRPHQTGGSCFEIGLPAAPLQGRY